DFRQRLRPAALHRRRSERPDDHRRYRIEQCLCSQRHNRHRDLAAQPWHASTIGNLPCGNIDPVGITGTPAVDLASRRLFFDALINGPTIKHFIYSLNVDTGATTPGWPVDVNATARYNGITFTSQVQEERGGLALVNRIAYVAYSGYSQDCGLYHGWVVGV